MTERGIDRLARWLARSDAGIQSSTPGSGSAFDVIARAAAAPVTRRRALVTAGGAMVVSSLLRPGSARADCYPGGPKVCSNAKGMKVCVPNNLECCSNDNCAIACPYPWRRCEQPGNCADTPKLCTDPTAPGYLKGNTQFCSQRVPVPNGCVSGGTSSSLRGWCCKPRETCSTTFGDCECPTPCGDDCCAATEECVSLGLFGGSKCMAKCNPGWHHDGVNCVCDSGQTCGLKCCPEGSVCTGSTCSKPKEPDNSFFNPFRGLFGFGDAINQTAASRGGGSGHIAHISAAASPIDAALLALAAVNAQGAAAATAFIDRQADSAYRHRVVAARPTPPAVTAGAGLDADGAAALRKLVAAEAKAFAAALASATALARARGAADHKNLTVARRQVTAAAAFAGQAAKALGPVPSLRAAAAAALRAGGVAEVVVTAADVSVFQSTVRSGGIPSDLAALLKRLGVEGADLGRAKASLLASSAGGPALIAPLDDPARTRNLRSMASELAKFSRDARRRPITRAHPAPRRYRSRAGG